MITAFCSAQEERRHVCHGQRLKATNWVVSTQMRKRGKIRRLKEVVLERQRTSEQYPCLLTEV